MYDVVTKRVEEQPYVSKSRRVTVRELETFICDTFEELGYEGDDRLPAGEVAHTQISSGPPREIYFNQITERLQMEIALPLR